MIYPIPAAVAIIYNNNYETITGIKLPKNKLIWPGGKIESGESPEDAVVREIKEETNLDIKPEFLLAARTVNVNDVDYINLYYMATIIGGELKVMEPEKHKDWKWTKLDDIKEIYTGSQILIPKIIGYIHTRNYISKQKYEPKTN